MYDVQGRRVGAPLSHAPLPAGEHTMSLQLDGLQPGVYVYRLEAGGRAASQKMLIVH